jgi:hypothetical protein
LSGAVKRVQTWNKFKALLIKSKSEDIYYAQGNAPLSRPPVELRLILVAENMQYVFIDTGHGDALRRTGIPIRVDKHGNFTLEEEDIKNFIHTQLGRNNIKTRSFELMGGY